ncbi:mitotic spindle checkpoint protein MAD1 [Cucurbita pepo subsp. pepo]|uniref:mitotic spindle checkpoint protein MAD1 n=1 Tax=Cucurbita pepo subsp. pepo TaxID=3664 RepID=UPI000C9D6D7C|nr:mitotic spindle checkpoint protein MAD1 [Cucurbita pepo subsp. pepo]
MIVRTPPPKKQRSEVRALPDSSSAGASDLPLVIYEDPLPVVPATTQPECSHEPSEQMLCTYQCRQMVKADFLDALSNAEKQVHDYELKLGVLNENLSKVESERKKFLDQLLYTEQELAAARGREKVLQEQLIKEINDSGEQLKKQMQISSELEVKLQNEANLRMKAESLIALSEEKAKLLEDKLNHFSESIERERKRLHGELAQLKGESKLSVSRINADLEKMACRASNAEKESELLKEQLEDLKKQLNECLCQKSELEKKLASFTVNEGTSKESNILIKHLQEELRNYESEVREARKLKSSLGDIGLLKEKLLEEKARKERAESELSKLQDIQLSVKNLEDELTRRELLIKDIPGITTYEDIPNKISSLQKEVIDNSIKMGEVNARLKQLEVALDAAQTDKQKAESEATLAKEKIEALKLETQQNELLLSVATEERDKLKSLVNELKSLKNGDADAKATSETISQELDSALAKKDWYIKELESNLHEQKQVNGRQHDELRLLNERLNNEAKRIKSLERDSDRLRSEISLLESKLGHGDFSSTNTKVLRMVNTLAVDNEAKQTIEALKSELQKTKEKLQAVEELKTPSGDAGKLVDSYISGKIMQLKEQIATLEKREERYKTVFADRISVFRRACCELFGYKIVMDEHQRTDGIPVTRFTLQSIYAQSDDEKLQFEYESGNTNILANNYTSQPELSRQVEIFIRKMNSIPAFTANLTVESFNRRTLS